MEGIIDLLKITIPAAIVLYAAYLIVKSFLEKQLETIEASRKIDLIKETLSLRLQAYERIIIFLERISPNNLIVRLNDNSFNVYQLQNILVKEVREEYNHNLSQQIYMSDESWDFVRKSMEEVIATINSSAHELNKEAPSIELAKKVFENVLQSEQDVNAVAAKHIKSEVRKLYS